MELAARTRLGRYEVVAPLGAGAMGEVYRARDTQLDRSVAIKVLAAGEPGSKNRADRFQREARAISRLHHAHICTLYDVGEEGGRVFLVMEDLEGETLAHRLESGPLPIDDVLRHAIEMAAGLDGAHRHGVVHRDLKPANVMLTPDGVKILDFGLARLTDPFADDVERARDAQTHSGLVVGTLPYMAPEQLEDGEADARTDIFALGAVMYEMTTGRRPFQASSQAALVAAILSSEPPALDRAVPPALEHAMRRCLAKNPDERWQTARDLAAELRWIREGASAGTSAPDRDRRRSVARRLWPAAAMLGALALALGLRAALPSRAPPPDTGTPTPRAVPAGMKALAVLPFENLGGPEDEYFADGITDELRGRLAGLPGLLVIASSSSNEYKKTTKAPRQIAGELGVQYLLLGKVRWEKDKDGQTRVRVSPELVEAATIATRWQQPFDAVLTDVFEVQATIATQVAQALGVALEQGERTRMAEKPTSSLAAWDAYLQGNEAMHGFESPADVVRAIDRFDRAVTLDPGFGLAWAQLSRGHTALYLYAVPSAARRAQAREAAEKAVALAPDAADAHLALAAYRGAILEDWPAALKEFTVALEKAPQDAELLTETARAQQAVGRWEEALTSLRQAQRIDPRSTLVARRLIHTLLCLRRYPEAVRAADRVLALSPQTVDLIERRAMIFVAQGDLAGARAVVRAAPPAVETAALAAHFATWWDLFWVLDDRQQQLLLRLTPASFADDRLSWGLALAQTADLRGDEAGARKFAEQARVAGEAQIRESPRDAQQHAMLGLALALLGRNAEAVRAGEHARVLSPFERDAYTGAYIRHQLARIYRRAGEPEKALDLLEGLLEVPYYLSPGWLRIDPEWAPLRDHPRFKKLSEDLG